MVQIQLDDDEVRMLIKTLEAQLAELRLEIGSTRIADFEETLRREEGLVESLLRRLREHEPQMPGSMFGEYGG